jgi:nucleotide-binding universal stress UspA family protein
VIPRISPGPESLYASVPWLTTPEVRQRIDEEMRRFLQPLREARINHEIEMREGEPWRETVALAEEMSADLVVLGTHGRGGLDRLFLGSVTEKLIRRLPCPVFTVSHEEGRTWAAPGLITRILCATDFSVTSLEAFRMAVALSEKFGAEITLLHAVESVPDFGDPTYFAVLDARPLREDLECLARERLGKALAEVGGSEAGIELRIAFGRAYREILKTAAEVRSDLIVIGAQGHGVLEHMLSGSNAQQVIRGATCPVLTVRPQPVKAPGQGAQATGLTLAPGSEHSS